MTFDQRKAQEHLVAAGYNLVVDGDFGGRSYAALMAYIARTPVKQMQVDLGKAAAKWFPEFGIVSPEAIACFLGQSFVETGGFAKLSEDLSYSAERIVKVWPKRFANAAAAAPYARSPEKLANKVYGGRFGNSQPGDGWKYRGRGTKQTTFHDNYAEVEKVTGLPVLDQPEMLAEPDTGMRAGCIYWREKGCGPLASAGDLLGLTMRVNGGVNGLPERTSATKRARTILY